MSTQHHLAQDRRAYLTSLIIIGALFFIFGFVTWANGPLILFVKVAFDLDAEWKAFFVTTAFFMAYFVFALPASKVLELTGMKRGMGLGLLAMAAGSVLFAHFTTARSYPGALSGLFVIGAGLALLQTAVNPYISIIGPIESAARRISIMGICNKFAGMLAPVVLGLVALRGLGDFEARIAAATSEAERELLFNQFAGQVYWPYMVMAGLLAAFAVWIMRSPLPEVKSAVANRAPEGPAAGGRSRLRQFPHLWLGALCLFLYVGAEVMAGDVIGIYGQSLGLPSDHAKFFTSLTLGGMLAGYIAGIIAIPRWISQERALAVSAVLGVAFTLGAFLTSGYLSVAFVALLGLANALMWPAIFPLAIKGLGALTERGSAILIMGIAGGAVIPKAFALLKEQFDFQWVFLLLMAPCYLYILYYGLVGHRAGQAGPAAAQPQQA